jgi:type VI secretion system secreted protein VgrG
VTDERLTNSNRFLQIDTTRTKLGHDPDRLVLMSFSGTEEMSKIFQYELSLLSHEHNISADDIIGENVTIKITMPGQQSYRYFNGFVSRFSHVSHDGRYAVYEAEVVPWLWFLTLTADCRIFQRQTVPDIIADVFSGFGFTGLFNTSALHGYREREYCVQYRETACNFVMRLMEQEGIFFFFMHDAGKHTLVMGDGSSEHDLCPRQSTVAARPAATVAGGRSEEDYVHHFRIEHELRSGRYSLNDYDFQKPRANLLAPSNNPVTQGRNTRFEIFDYPGQYEEFDDAEKVVRMRMEEEAAPREVIIGEGNVRSFSPGFKILLYEETPLTSISHALLLVSVTHDAYDGSYPHSQNTRTRYSNSFTCIPNATVFRPPRVTPKPMVQGPQTAVVVGPKDESGNYEEEIWTDSYGRVKVHFYWNRRGKRDQDSSCWIRVSQAWAGKRWGATFLPRIGQEVIVDFLEGDPDRPIIIGAVYNAEQMPPYFGGGPDTKHADDPNVSGIKTNSTKGGEGYNEVRFDDTKDREQIFIHAQHNMDVRVVASHMHTVGGSYHVTVGGEKDGAKHGDYRQMVFKNKETIVREEMKTKIEGKCSLSIDGDFVHYTNKKHHASATEGYYFQSNAKILLEAVQEICLSVGPSFIKIAPAGIWITGPMVYINSGGAPSTETMLGCDLPVNPAGADNSRTGSKSAPAGALLPPPILPDTDGAATQ